MTIAKVEKLNWERIRLWIIVSVLDEDRSEVSSDALSFYLTDASASRAAAILKPAKTEDGLYYLPLNVTNRGDARVLGRGNYGLAVCDRDGGFLCYADCDLPAGELGALHRFFPYQGQRGLGYTLSSGQVFLHVSEKKGNAARRLLSGSKYAMLQLYYNIQSLRFSRDRDRTVLLITEMDHRIGGNLLAVQKRLEEREVKQETDRKYRILVSARNSRGKEAGSLLEVLKKTAASSVIIADDHIPFLDRIDPGKDRKLLQLWHAGVGFKATGYSRWGHQGAIAPMSAHRRITYGIAASRQTAGIFAELWGIADERVIPLGIPRMDALLREATLGKESQVLRHLLQKYPILRDKRVILFAPTYRGKARGDAYYPLDRLDLMLWAERARAGGYAVLIKLHPWVQEKGFVPDACRDVIEEVHAESELTELMLLADMLVTDYSSAIFEFAALRKPMAFYAFDEEAYAAERGFHRPYRENAPGPVVGDFQELLDLLDGPWDTEAVEAYAKRHFDILDGKATDRVIDWLIEGKLPKEYREAVRQHDAEQKECENKRFPAINKS